MNLLANAGLGREQALGCRRPGQRLGDRREPDPYYVGQRGTRAVFEHYPKLQGRPWERLEAAFQRWGAFSLILSGIPGLGAALLVGAGAFGIQRRVFLVWVYVGKVLRYWMVVFVVLASFQLVS